MIIACDVQALEVEWDGSTFNLSGAGPFVCPDLEIVAKALTLFIEVIDKDSRFSFVVVPPFVLSL